MSDTGDSTTRIGIDASVTGAESVAGLTTNVVALSQQLINLSQSATRSFSVQDTLNKALDRTRLSTGLVSNSLAEYRKSQVLTNRVVEQATQQLNALTAAQAKVAASGKAMSPALSASYRQANTHLTSVVSSADALNRVLKTNAIEKFGQKLQASGQIAQRTSYYFAAATAPLLMSLRSAFFSYARLDQETRRLTKLIADEFGTGAEAISKASDKVRVLGFELDKITAKYGTSRVLVQSLAGDFAELGVPDTAIVRLTEFTAAVEKLGNLDITQSQNFIQSIYQNILRVRRDMAAAEGYSLDLSSPKMMGQILSEVQGQLALFNMVENKTTLSLKDLADAFPEVSAAATTFGLSMTETAAMLAPMVAAGFQVGASANSIKVSLQRMVAMTKQNTGIIQGLNQALGDDFEYAAGVGMENIQQLVDGFNSLLSIKGEQGTLEFFSRLFGVRQGPRMETSIRQLAVFQKALDNTSTAEGKIAAQLESSINARLTSHGYEAVSVKKIVDLANVHRKATQEINGEYTIQARLVQQGQKDADAALKGAYTDTADYLSKVGTEAGKIFFTEAVGGVAAASIQMEQELGLAVDSVAVKFNKLKEAMLQIGRALAPIVDKVIGAILPVIQGIGDFLKQLSPFTQKIIGFLAFTLILIPQIRLLAATFKMAFGGIIGSLGKMMNAADGLGATLKGVRATSVSLAQILENPNIAKGYNKLTQITDSQFLLQQDKNAPGYSNSFLGRRRMRPMDASGLSQPVKELFETKGVVGPTDKTSIKTLLGKSTKLGLPNTDELIRSMLTDMGTIPEKIAESTAKATEKAATSTAEKITKGLKGSIFQNNTFIGNKFGGGTAGPGGTGTGPRTPKTPATGGTPTVPRTAVPTPVTPPAPSTPAAPSRYLTDPRFDQASTRRVSIPSAKDVAKTATIGAPIAATAERMAAEAKAQLDALGVTVQEEVAKATKVVKEATKPKGKSPRGSPKKVKTTVEKAVGEAVSVATAPVAEAVEAVTEASTETPKKVEKAVKEVKNKAAAPKGGARKVKAKVEKVVGEAVVAAVAPIEETVASVAQVATETPKKVEKAVKEVKSKATAPKGGAKKAVKSVKKVAEQAVVAVEKTVAGVAEVVDSSAAAQAAVEKATTQAGKATKVASKVAKAPTGQAAIVKLSYKEIAKFFDDAGQAIPSEYEFIRTTNKEVELTKRAKNQFFQNLTKQFEKGSTTPLGALSRPGGRPIYKIFNKEVNAQKDAYKSLVDELLVDRRSLEQSVKVKDQISSTLSQMLQKGGGTPATTSTGGMSKAAARRLAAEKKRAQEAIVAMNATEALKLDAMPGGAPPSGVEEIYTTRPKAEIAAIEKSLAEAKSNLKIVEKEGTDVAKQLSATYRKQIDDLREELLLARSAIHERLIPASPATSQLLNAQNNLMRDESPLQNLTSGRTPAGVGIGPDNPVRYANQFSDRVGSMPRVISKPGGVLEPKVPVALNPDIRAKILHDLEVEKLSQRLIESTDASIVKDLKSHMADIEDEVRFKGKSKTFIKKTAAREMAENLGVDLTKYLPTSDEFDPAAEAAILKNKKVVNGVTQFYKGIEHGGDELVAELAGMQKDVSPASTSAREKLAKAFIRQREAISPSDSGGRTASPIRKIISGGMGKAKAGVVTVGKLIEDSINETVNALPASISDAKRQLIRATAIAVASQQPGAAVGEALQGGLKLVDQELTESQSKVVKGRLDLMRKQVLDLMGKDVAGFKTATITDSKGKITKFVSEAKSKAGVLLNKLAKGTALSVSDLGKAVEGVFVDSMGAASYAVTQVEKTKKGFRGFQFKDMVGRVKETLDARVAAGTKAQASAANVGSGTAVGNRAAERQAAKEAQKVAQQKSKEEADQIVKDIQARKAGTAAAEVKTQATVAETAATKVETESKVKNTAATEVEAAAKTEAAVVEKAETASTTKLTGAKEALTGATARGATAATVDEQITKALGKTKVAQIAKLESQIATMTAEQLASDAGVKVQKAQADLKTKLNTLVKAQTEAAAAQANAEELGRASTSRLKTAKEKLASATQNAKIATEKLAKAVVAASTDVAAVAPALTSAASSAASGSGAGSAGTPKAPRTPRPRTPAAAIPASASGGSAIVKAIEKQTLQFDSSLANFFKGPNFFQGPNIFQGKLISADKLNLKIKDSAKAAKDAAKALPADDPLVVKAKARQNYKTLKDRIESRTGVPLSEERLERLKRLTGVRTPTALPAVMEDARAARAATRAADIRARVLSSVAASRAATASSGAKAAFRGMDMSSLDKVKSKLSSFNKMITGSIAGGFNKGFSLAGNGLTRFAQLYVKTMLSTVASGTDMSMKVAKSMTYLLSGGRKIIDETGLLGRAFKALAVVNRVSMNSIKSSAVETAFVMRALGTVVKSEVAPAFSTMIASLRNSKIIKAWTFLLFTGMNKVTGALRAASAAAGLFTSHTTRMKAVGVALDAVAKKRVAAGLAETIPVFQRLIIQASAYTGIGRGLKAIFASLTKTMFAALTMAIKLKFAMLLIAPVFILIAGFIMSMKSGLVKNNAAVENFKSAWVAIREAIITLSKPLMEMIGKFGGLGKASNGANAVSGALHTLSRFVKYVADGFSRFAKGPGMRYMQEVIVPVLTRMINRFILLGRTIAGVFRGDASAIKNFKGLLLSLAYEAFNSLQKLFGFLANLLPKLGPLLSSMIEAVLNATIDAFMYIMNFGKEVALFFGSMMVGIGGVLSFFTGPAGLGVAAMGAGLIAAAGAAHLLDKNIGRVKSGVKGVSTAIGTNIAQGLGKGAGFIEENIFGNIKRAIARKYGETIGADVNSALASQLSDPADVKKALNDTLGGAAKNAPGAKAAGESLGEAIAKGIKDKLISLKEDWTGNFFGKADDQVAKITENYKEAIDKQKEEALKAFDTQVSAIEALGKAEEELTAKMDYEEKRREMIRSRALDKENYLRERKIAKYEGRTEDVRSLDLSFRKSDQAAGKDITNLDTERAKTLQEQQRSIAIAVINREKDIMAQSFDEMQKQFDINLEKILNKGFSTKEEFSALLSEIGGAVQGFSGELNKTFEGAMTSLPSIIRKSTDPSVGMFSMTMQKLVDQAKISFGAEVRTGDASSILGSAYAMANGMPDAFKQAFSEGVISESVTPFIGKISTIMGGLNVDAIWIEAGRSATEAMIGEMKRKLRALKGDLYDEFKNLFAGMGAEYNQLFPTLEKLAKEIARIEAIRSQSGGGGGDSGSTGGGSGYDSLGKEVISVKYGEHLARKPVEDIGAALDPKKFSFFGMLIEGAKDLVKALGPVKTAILGAVGVIAGFMALKGLFVIIAGAFETLMLAAMYAVQPIGVALAGVSAVGLAIAAAVGVAVGVVIYMYLKFKWFRDMVNDTFKDVIGFFVTGFQMLKDPVVNFLSGVWDAVKQIFDSLFGPIIDFGKKIVMGIVGAIAAAFVIIFGALRGVSIALDWIKVPLFNIIGWVINLATGIVGVLADIISGAIDFVYKIIGALFTVGIGGPIKLVIEAFKLAFDIIVGIVKIAIDLIIKAFDFLKGPLSGPFEVGFEIIKDIFNKIKDIVSGVIDFIKNLFGGVDLNDVAGPLTAPFKVTFDFIKDVFSKVFDIVKGVFENIISFIAPVGITITNILLAPFKLLFDVFKAIASNPVVVFFARLAALIGLVAAIAATWTIKIVLESTWALIKEVVGALIDLGKFIVGGLVDAFNIIKDVAIKAWDFIYEKVKGFIDWWHEEIGSLWLIFVAVFAILYEAARWFFSWMKDTFGPILAKVWDAFKDAIGTVWDLMKEVGSWIGSAFSAVWDVLKKAASLYWDYLNWAIDFAWGAMKTVASWIGTVFSVIWDVVKKAASLYWDYLNWAVDFAWSAMKTVASWIGSAFGLVWDVVKKAASLYWDYLNWVIPFIWDTMKKVASWIGTAFGVVWGVLKKAASLYWDYLSWAIDFAWEGMKKVVSWIGTAFSKAWDVVSVVAKKAFEILGGAISFVWELITGGWSAIRPTLETIGNFVRDVITDAWDVLVYSVKAFWDIIKFGWDMTKPVFDGLWGIIWRVIGPAVRLLGRAFGLLWDGIKAAWGFVEPIFSAMVEIISNVLGPVVEFLGLLFQGIWDGIMAGWGLIKPVFDWIADIVGNVIKGYVEALQFVFGLLWDGIKAGWDLVGPIFGWIVDIIGQGIKGAIDIVMFLWDNFWNGIKISWSFLKPIFDFIVDAIKTGIGFAIDLVKKGWDTFVAVLKNTKDFIVGIIQTIGNWIRDGIQFVIERVIGVWNGLKDAFSAVWSFIQPIISKIGDAIKNVIGGAIDFIKAAIEAIPQAFKLVVNSIGGLFNRAVDVLGGFAFPKTILGIPLPYIGGKKVTDFIPLPKIPTLFNGGKAGMYMKGGMAYGSGGMTYGPAQQGIPAILHGGEYVINHKAVQRIGTDALDRLNNYKLSKPNFPTMPSVPSIKMPNVSMNNSSYAQPSGSSTQNVNIYVDNFIGEPEWFNGMMKDYNTKVLPRNQKSAGLESRVINTYNGLNRGL
jgi:phage-related protein